MQAFWSDRELKAMEVKTRNRLTMFGTFHKKESVQGLYMKRKGSGRRLIDRGIFFCNAAHSAQSWYSEESKLFHIRQISIRSNLAILNRIHNVLILCLSLNDAANWPIIHHISEQQLYAIVKYFFDK